MKTAAEFNLAQIIASIAPSICLESESSTPAPAGAQFAALLGAAVDVAALRESGNALATFAEADSKPSPQLEPVISLSSVRPAVPENTALERRVSVDDGLAITTVSFLSGRKVLVAPALTADYPLEGVSSLPAWWSEQLPPLPAQSLSAAMALVHARSTTTADPQNLPPETSLARTASRPRPRRPNVQPAERASVAAAEGLGPNPTTLAEPVWTVGETNSSKLELPQHKLQRVNSAEIDDRNMESETSVAVIASATALMTSPERVVASTPVDPGHAQLAQSENAPAKSAVMAPPPALIHSPRRAPIDVPPRAEVAVLPSLREAMDAAARLRAGPQESWDEMSPTPAAEGAPTLPALNATPVAAVVGLTAPSQVPPRAEVAALPSLREALDAAARLRAGPQESWDEMSPTPAAEGAPTLPALNATPVAAVVGPTTPIQVPPHAKVAEVQTLRADLIVADPQPHDWTSFAKPKPVASRSLDVTSPASGAAATNRDNFSNNVDSTPRIPSSLPELGSLATSLNYDQSATSMSVAPPANWGPEVTDPPSMLAAPERTLPQRPLSRPEFADAVLRFAAFEVELPERGGVSRMRLEVTPADLGHLDIEVRHEGDAIDVRITATDPSAVSTLRESGHIIRDLLSREEGGRVTVTIDVAAKDGSGGEGRGQGRGAEQHRNEGSEPEPKLLRVRLRDNNQFDVYV